jgi:hypothetical protein
MKPSRNEIMVALAKSFEQGDLQFIETVNNVAFGYKAELKRNLKSNEQRMD